MKAQAMVVIASVIGVANGQLGAVRPSTPFTPGGGFVPDCCCPYPSPGANTVSYTCPWTPCCSGPFGHAVDPGYANPMKWIRSNANRCRFGECNNPFPAPIGPAFRRRELLEDEASAETAEMPENIIEALGDMPDATNFIAALEKANLTDALTQPWMTVFVPTNAAISRAAESLNETVEELLADTEALALVLGYHIVEGPVAATDITNDGSVPSLLRGVELTITLVDGKPAFEGAIENVTDPYTSEGSIFADSAKVLESNEDIANGGIIHFVDNILIPPLGALAEALGVMAPDPEGSD